MKRQAEKAQNTLEAEQAKNKDYQEALKSADNLIAKEKERIAKEDAKIRAEKARMKKYQSLAQANDENQIENETALKDTKKSLADL